MRLRAALLLGCAVLSGCQAAATAALTIGSEIVVRAFQLDAAVINDIRARKDAEADPQMKGVLPERTER